MTCERCGHEVQQLKIQPTSAVTVDITGIGHPESECIANLRANLAEAREEIKEIEAFRAAPLATIRKLLGDDESCDEAIAGDICAMILTRRALGAKKREAEAHVGELARDLEAERAHVRELENKLDFENDANQYQRMNTLRQEAMAARAEAEERAARAEAQCTAIRMIVEKALVTARCVVDSQHALPLDKVRVVHDLESVLAADPGDLLTAVRRLMGAATALYQATTTVDAHNRDAAYALRAALANPVLKCLLP